MTISIENYKTLIKEKRGDFIKQPYDLIYDNFIKLGYHKVQKDFFLKKASDVVEKVRESSWGEFLPLEKKFTSTMLQTLIDKDTVRNMTPENAIMWFVEKYPDHIYALNLSNTQSRRSRAGKEFECIIELILIGTGIPLDSQGNIGKQEFVNKGLGKMVDVVSPGVLEYLINKRNTVLISAKTTLRERWQEVPEEMGRTGAREMFLATLDTTISSDVLNTLYEANIQVTTTKRIKEQHYTSNSRILTFEKLLEICLDNLSHWDNHNYSVEETEKIVALIDRQIEKHNNHDFVKDYYHSRLKEIKK